MAAPAGPAPPGRKCRACGEPVTEPDRRYRYCAECRRRRTHRLPAVPPPATDDDLRAAIRQLAYELVGRFGAPGPEAGEFLRQRLPPLIGAHAARLVRGRVRYWPGEEALLANAPRTRVTVRAVRLTQAGTLYEVYWWDGRQTRVDCLTEPALAPAPPKNGD